MIGAMHAASGLPTSPISILPNGHVFLIAYVAAPLWLESPAKAPGGAACLGLYRSAERELVTISYLEVSAKLAMPAVLPSGGLTSAAV